MVQNGLEANPNDGSMVMDRPPG